MTDVVGTNASAPAHGGPLLATISNGVVGIMREMVGKGPTRARTHWAGPDTLLVLLGGGYSAAEHTMAQSGHEREVQSSRRALQEAMEGRMKSMVADITGRKVVAFMSTNHFDPDLMAEIFVLQPDDGRPWPNEGGS